MGDCQGKHTPPLLARKCAQALCSINTAQSVLCPMKPVLAILSPCAAAIRRGGGSLPVWAPMAAAGP